MKQYQNFINGEWVPAASGDTFTNHNPADTRMAVAEYAKGGTDDAQAAVEAAQAAFPAWRDTTPPARGKILSAVANILASRQGELAELLCREEGKTKIEAGMEVGRTVDISGSWPGSPTPSAGRSCLMIYRITCSTPSASRSAWWR